MSNILLLTSSLFGEKSQSRAVAAELIAELRRAHRRSRLVTRDLNAVPHLSGDVLQALGAAPEARSLVQQRALALADELIEELEAADIVVIAAPMYNFTISSPLKAWIDHVARAGRTFRYTADGAIGLLKGKKVFVASATGGIYGGESPARAMDFQEPYLRAILGFMGLNDVTFVRLEGLNISPEVAAKAWSSVHAQIAAVVPQALAA